MVLRLFVIAITFTCAVTHASNFTNSDAGAWAAASSLGQAGLAYAGKQVATKDTLVTLFSQRAVTNAVIAQKLTESNIAEITRLVENSWFPRTGIGQWGGAEIEIVHDRAQLSHLQGADNLKAVNERAGVKSTAVITSESTMDAAEKAKPVLESETIKVRLTKNPAALRADLEKLAQEGAVVSRVDVKTMIKGPGLRAISGVLSVYFAGNMASNAYRAYDFSQKSARTSPTSANIVVDNCKGSDSNDCKIPWYRIDKFLWNTGDSVFYTFYADQ